MASWLSSCCCGDSSTKTAEEISAAAAVGQETVGLPTNEKASLSDAEDSEQIELKTPRPANAATAAVAAQQTEATTKLPSNASSLVDSRSGSAGETTKSSDEKKKLKEKEHLQRLVREFAASSVNGVEARIYDEEGYKVVNCTFQMERHLRWFTVTRTDGGSNDSATFYMDKIVTVTKSKAEITKQVPTAPRGVSELSVLVVSEEGSSKEQPRQVLFVFSEPVVRDRFYTCVKILKMTISINKKNQTATATGTQ